MGIFYKMYIIKARKMLLAQFIWLMILAAHQSGKMLQQPGLLRTGEEFMVMSPESRLSLLRKLAEQCVTPNQCRELIKYRLRAFLVARLLGKQSRQHSQMRVPVHVLKYLMMMGIPRQLRITPLICGIPPQNPRATFTKSDYALGDSVPGSSFHSTIVDIKVHPQWVVLTDDRGRVWIWRRSDERNIYRLVYTPDSKNSPAKSCAIHPSKDILFIGIRDYIIVCAIHPSPAIKEITRKRFCDETYTYTQAPKYSACNMECNASGKILTAISRENQGLSKVYAIDPVTSHLECVSGFAHLNMYPRHSVPPMCSSSFLPNGNTVIGHSEGHILTGSFGDGKSFCYKELTRVTSLEEYIFEKVSPSPSNARNVAIMARRDSDYFDLIVQLLWIAPDDGTTEIIETFEGASNIHFHKDLLLVSIERSIRVYVLKSDSKPVKITEFQSQIGQIDSFFVTTDVNGNVTIHYHTYGKGIHRAVVVLE